MENLEIVFRDVPKSILDKIWEHGVNYKKEDILSSHFSNKNEEFDISILQVKSLEEVLSPKGSGYITLSQLIIGIPLGETVISLSFDEEFGDIEFNFKQEGFDILSPQTIYENIITLLKEIKVLSKKYRTDKVYYGYEPATDYDTCMVNFAENELDVEELALKIRSTLYNN